MSRIPTGQKPNFTGLGHTETLLKEGFRTRLYWDRLQLQERAAPPANPVLGGLNSARG